MLHKNAFKFILASASLRRQELLSRTGLEYRVITPDIDESNIHNENGLQHAMTLSLKKAKKVSEMLEGNFIIISADTVVLLDNRIFGKPSSPSEAECMLNALSGKTHEVITAVTVYNTSGILTLTKFSKTDVTFSRLDKETIREYIRIAQPMDFAGAYGIQGAASMFIEEIKGDYNNVVGLPLNLLYGLLHEVGYDLLANRWIRDSLPDT